MYFQQSLLALAAMLSASALAANAAPPSPAEKGPTPVELAPRNAITEMCGQFQNGTFGNFNVSNNAWGEQTGVGYQCTYVDCTNGGDTISWHLDFNWTEDYDSVKGYANAYYIGPVQLNTITSMPTSWQWSYTGSDLIVDVSYDAFFAKTPTIAQSAWAYEVMVWLSTMGGAQPIGYPNGTLGTIQVGGTTFDLYAGPNQYWTVYSFIANVQNDNFTGDITDFFNYLYDNQGVPNDYYLTTIGAGTETFTGTNAVFNTSSYTLDVNTS